MGISVGVSNHFGEIGGRSTEAKGFVGDLLLSQTIFLEDGLLDIKSILNFLPVQV